MGKKFKITNLPVDIDLNQYGEELHKTMQVFTISMLKRSNRLSVYLVITLLVILFNPPDQICSAEVKSPLL
jgi:hypothetical protein